jgi:hypothetical protein
MRRLSVLWAQRLTNIVRQPAISGSRMLVWPGPSTTLKDMCIRSKPTSIFSNSNVRAIFFHVKAATKAHAVSSISHRAFFSKPPSMPERQWMTQNPERKGFWRGNSGQSGGSASKNKGFGFLVYFMAATGLFVWTFEIVDRLLAYYFPENNQHDMIQDMAAEKATIYFFGLEDLRYSDSTMCHTHTCAHAHICM